MGKPTEEELKIALEEAARMRESGEDPCFIAKSLLNHNYRLKHLEDVLHAAELYTRSGMGTTEHTKLVSAIKTCRDLERQSAGTESNNYIL